ncbi:E3 ubiquitin-protein ligase BRE1B-like, partial [Chiloscyllium plagiosum]|uniref:E3 ubiquitin-protein ligase BRE1B-like n=1 Tax=Chiloscyllium plagiosum TaxID=36176 RepID=UPI001CB7D7D9
ERNRFKRRLTGPSCPPFPLPQVDAQLLVVQKLEEKERVLQSSLAMVEKELTLRSQALELNKRKAVEAAQLAEDLKVQLEHTQAKLKEIQSAMSDNCFAKEKESFNLKRAQVSDGQLTIATPRPDSSLEITPRGAVILHINPIPNPSIRFQSVTHSRVSVILYI